MPASSEQGRSLSFYDAADVVRRNTIFTTHTPVPAGIDRFGWDLVERYLLRYASGLTLEELKEFGRDPNPKEDCLNMAVIGLRLSDRANGVSKLNGEQARKMFAMVSDAAPITSITNGVHPQTWTDVWLNNPLRPYEACGTSGMKAAYAGALNLSELDGWWDECSDGINGFDIGEGVNDQDPAVTAALVMKAIKKQILPRFENRNEAGLPPMWVNKIRLSMASLGPLVGAPRMVKDYVLELYIPAHEAGMEILELAA
jgi:glucan phosphorylase